MAMKRILFPLLLIFQFTTMASGENIPVIYVTLDFPDEITIWWDVPNLQTFKQERAQKVLTLLSNNLPAWNFKLRTAGDQFPHLSMAVQRRDNDLTNEAKLVVKFLPQQNTILKDWSAILAERGEPLPGPNGWDELLEPRLRFLIQQSSSDNPGILQVLKKEVRLGDAFFLNRTSPWAVLPINADSHPCLKYASFKLAVENESDRLNLISEPGGVLDYPPDSQFKGIRVTYNLMLRGIQSPQEVPIPDKQSICTGFEGKEFYLYALGPLSNCDRNLSEAPPSQ